MRRRLWGWDLLVWLAGLVGIGVTVLYVWYNPFLKAQDSSGLALLGLAPLEQRLQPKPKLEADAATLRLKRWLLEARYRPLNPKAKGEGIILMYHDAVLKRDGQDVWFDTTPEEFARELGWLKQRGANFISLDQLRAHLTQNQPLPPNPVALTFDDNYIGFFNYIYPVLKRERIPAAMFVHTNYVGTQGKRPKMTWDTLRQLVAEGLITVGSHTLSHPEDISKLNPAQQRKELLESKWILERELGRPMVYISYPNGKADVVTWKIAREVGYAMGFMEEWQMPGDSPDMLAVGRYIQTQLTRAWYDLNPEQRPQPRKNLVEYALRQRPVRLEYRAGLALIRGGRAESRLSPYRESVPQFMAQAGAVAGINGTFFADPLLKSNDNTIVGPVVAQPYGRFIPERNPYVLYRIVERPLVAWNAQRIVFTPLKLDMNRAETVKAFISDYSDVFVGGAWIVRGGKAVWPIKNPPSDHGDWRPRVFFGYADGEVVLGATLRPMSTVGMARAAAAAGIQEAVLLDSGYSSSLVFQNQRIVVGRQWDGVPSRPVPHAIVLHGSVQRALSQAKARP